MSHPAADEPTQTAPSPTCDPACTCHLPDAPADLPGILDRAYSRAATVTE